MRTKRKHHGPETKFPPLPPIDRILYHWSPSSNRASITRHGLKVNRLSLQGEFRPPYVALADDPWLAWILSGQMYPGIKKWDLWMVNVENQTSFKGWEIITDTYRNSERTYRKEYRVYTRIFKRDLIYLGSRTQ